MHMNDGPLVYYHIIECPFAALIPHRKIIESGPQRLLFQLHASTFRVWLSNRMTPGRFSLNDWYLLTALLISCSVRVRTSQYTMTTADDSTADVLSAYCSHDCSATSFARSFVHVTGAIKVPTFIMCLFVELASWIHWYTLFGIFIARNFDSFELFIKSCFITLKLQFRTKPLHDMLLPSSNHYFKCNTIEPLSKSVLLQ